MHIEVLTAEQRDLLPFITSLKKEYSLVGDTAMALYLGHRSTEVLEFGKSCRLNPDRILLKIASLNYSGQILSCTKDKISILINSTIHCVFSRFYYPIISGYKFDDYIWLPSLIDLAAFKAYHLSINALWADYVDLYFILKDFYTLNQITERIQTLFMPSFSATFLHSNLMNVEKANISQPIQFTDRKVDKLMVYDYFRNLEF